MLMTAQAVRRLMTLFRAYETFPHDPEFVRLAVLPAIAAELTCSLQHLIHFNRITGIYEFQSNIEYAYRQALEQRELTIVQGFALKIPTRENQEKNISITWSHLLHPQLQHSIEIPCAYMETRERDTMLLNAYERLRRVTKLLSEEEKNASK